MSGKSIYSVPLKYRKQIEEKNAFSELYFGCDISEKNYFIDSFTMPSNPKFNKQINKKSKKTNE